MCTLCPQSITLIGRWATAWARRRQRALHALRSVAAAGDAGAEEHVPQGRTGHAAWRTASLLRTLLVVALATLLACAGVMVWATVWVQVLA